MADAAGVELEYENVNNLFFSSEWKASKEGIWWIAGFELRDKISELILQLFLANL